MLEGTNNETGLAKMDGLIPANMAQAMDMASVLATSTMIPDNYRGKPGDVLAAIVMGAEVGLKPMQALKAVAVINGKPALYGDTLLAVIKTKPDYEYIAEEFDDGKMVATCRAKRKGEPEVVRTFSKADATEAGLWGKAGPWKLYPKRMLQMRARAFAIRDTFPHHLSGVSVAEEVQDIPTAERDITPATPALPAPASRTEAVKEALKQATAQPETVAPEAAPEPGVPGGSDIEALRKAIAECKTADELAQWAEKNSSLSEEVRAAIRPDFNKRQKELKK